MPNVSTLIFEEINGGPIARLPHRQDGTPRIVDGAQFFNLEQAAARFKGWSEAGLRELYATTFGDVASIVGGQLTDSPESDALVCERPAATDAVKQDLLAALYPQLEPVELATFLELCANRQVNPWRKLVIPIIRHDEHGNRQIELITTIDYLRAIAEQSGTYAGQRGPQWCGKDEVWRDTWDSSDGPPHACRVGILKSTFAEPLWGFALYRDLVQQNENGAISEHWEQRGATMLAKCAEANGHRRAFAAASRLYVAEEMPPQTPRRPAVPQDDEDGYRVEPSYDQLSQEEAAARAKAHERRRRSPAMA